MNSFNIKKVFIFLAVQALTFICISMVDFSPKREADGTPTTTVLKRSFSIEVHTVGDLEAVHSTSIACAIRSDQPKIIQLVSDGAHVDTNDLLVKIDPSPFEKKVEELQATILEGENQIKTLERALAWEEEQAIHEAKAAEFEKEGAELELNKIVNGDGPLEKARLYAAMLKTQIKYEELLSFSKDLIELEEQGYLNPAEVHQTQKKLQEEKENYENAKLQYESFVQHVYPMQIKKAETALKRLGNKQEESKKLSQYKIAKALLALSQAQQQLVDAKRQMRDAMQELALTEIKAPSPGMVVLREDYRLGQKRKPRVGDTLVRNQTILELPDLSQMIVKTKVREIDLYKIDINTPATIEVDAYPNMRFEGKVIFIGILAISDLVRPGDEKCFEVKVELTKTDPRLRPGMTSRVTLHAGNVENALAIPIHSVFEFNKKYFCYVLQNGGYLKQPIEIGMSNEQWIAVLAGLNENDQVSLLVPPEEAIITPKNNVLTPPSPPIFSSNKNASSSEAGEK